MAVKIRVFSAFKTLGMVYESIDFRVGFYERQRKNSRKGQRRKKKEEKDLRLHKEGSARKSRKKNDGETDWRERERIMKESRVNL